MDPVTGEKEDRSRWTFTRDAGGLPVVFLRSGTYIGLSGVLQDLDHDKQEGPVRSYCSLQAVPSGAKDVPLSENSVGYDTRGLPQVIGVSELIWKKRWDVRRFPYRAWGEKGLEWIRAISHDGLPSGFRTEKKRVSSAESFHWVVVYSL